MDHPQPGTFPVHIVASCFIKNTEGAFTITVMSQTHGCVLHCEPVVKFEDMLVKCMGEIDRDWADATDEQAGLIKVHNGP